MATSRSVSLTRKTENCRSCSSRERLDLSNGGGKFSFHELNVFRSLPRQAKEGDALGRQLSEACLERANSFGSQRLWRRRSSSSSRRLFAAANTPRARAASRRRGGHCRRACEPRGRRLGTDTRNPIVSRHKFKFPKASIPRESPAIVDESRTVATHLAVNQVFKSLDSQGKQSRLRAGGLFLPQIVGLTKTDCGQQQQADWWSPF